MTSTTTPWWTGTKPALFENIRIPEDFGPFEIVVDERMVKNYAFAQDDQGSAALPVDGPPSAHPAVLCNELLFLFYATYDGNTAQGLHTREDISFHSPIRIGETVTIGGRYVETYTRRGKGYVVMEAEARGDDGRLLVRHRGTEIMHVRAADVVGRATAPAPDRLVTGEVRDVDPAFAASVDLPERTPIVPVRKHISQEQMYVFSWGGRGFSNIHTDAAGARKSGMDRTVAQAMQQIGYLAQMMTAFHGPAFVTDGHLSVKFVRPFYVDDVVHARGAVLGPVERDGRRHLESEVWVENQDGEKTAVGWGHAPAQES
jgi:acyl dehydratase